MLDKNKISIQTGDVVRIEGASVKRNNGLYYVQHDETSPNYWGRNLHLRKISKYGKISVNNNNINFWPMRHEPAATIEVVEGVDKAEIIEALEAEQDECTAQLEYYELHGWNPSDIEREKACIAWYESNLARIKATYRAKPKPQGAEKPKASIPNQYGVKVGDIFASNWGYEQTNVEHFQVVRTTKTGVYVREVAPQVVHSETISYLSEDNTYLIDPSKILPPVERPHWIRDQKNGDYKKICGYTDKPSFTLSSFASAWRCEPGHVTEYESHYA